MKVEEMIANGSVQAGMQKFQAALEADPMLNQLAEAAKSIEEMFNVAKNFIIVEFNEFRQVFEDVMEFYSEPKLALADEVLDGVGGGFSWSSFGKLALCVAVGMLVAGPIGMAAGAGIAKSIWKA